MEKVNVLFGNKLIAEFIYPNIIWDYAPRKLPYEGHDKIENWLQLNLKSGWANHLEYHKSWDWLMSVVEKIESLDLTKWYDTDNFSNCSVNIEHSSCYIWLNLNYDPGKRVVAIHNGTYETKIETVYNAILEFIKWYNEHK
jgi:hypothetical protein